MISSAILDNGSLAHPGGNITGVTLVSSDIAAKRLQFLRDIAPNFTRLAVIWNTGTNTSFAPLKQNDADVLSVGYAESGPANGPLLSSFCMAGPVTFTAM
jgi:hypothetical protein